MKDDLGSPLYCTCLHILENRDEIKTELNSNSTFFTATEDTDSSYSSLSIMSEKNEFYSPDLTRITITESSQFENNQFQTDRYSEQFYTNSLPASPNYKYKPLFLGSPTTRIVPKALVFVSRSPFFEVFKKILLMLYKMGSDGTKVPLECIISHLVLSIPQPPRGEVELMYHLNNQYFKFAFPPHNNLPLLDINLGVLFHRLDLENIMGVFLHLSLERSVVFLSTSEDYLTSCSYSLLSLLFPFR